MLDDLKRALRMESPTPRLSETNLRKLSRGFRSSKKSRLSAASDVESCSAAEAGLAGRSASLSTLLPSGGGLPNPRRPRVDKLQTVEAKMAGIEVSLGWRKRREVMLETLPRAARELVRELDSLHQALRDRDGTIQSLRTQITNLGGSVKTEPAPAGQPTSPGDVLAGATGLTEAERLRVEDRIAKVLIEIESKKVAVRNIRMTLEKIDMTDNIDVRIRAAEMEYELEREELNILNLREEVSVLETRLQETTFSSSPQIIKQEGSSSFPEYSNQQQVFPSAVSTSKTPSSTAGNGTRTVAAAPPGRCVVTLRDLLHSHGSLGMTTTVVAVTVQRSPEAAPPFHLTCRTHPTAACVVDWATDDTRLKRGDKLVEVNGEMVLGAALPEVLQLISSHPLLDLVVIRVLTAPQAPLVRPLSDEERGKETRELQARLERAVRERDEARSDRTRLTHRISYLEDQVTELEATFKRIKEPNAGSSSSSSSPAPSAQGTTVIQVYQKGQQTLAVARPRNDCNFTNERSKKYPSLSSCRLDQHFCTSPPRRTSSSSSKSSGTQNPSCASSSSGYSSFTSFRSSTSQSNHHHHRSGGHQETLEAIRASTRPNSSAEHRRPRRILSPRPDSRSEVDCRSYSKTKPLPPKKPERLSLQRATSLLSVDQVVLSNCRSSRCLDGTSQDDHFAPANIWKSTGNGLNCAHSDAPDTFQSSTSSSAGSFSKHRAEFISRRVSSPMPVNSNFTNHNNSNNISSKNNYDTVVTAGSENNLHQTLSDDQSNTKNCSPQQEKMDQFPEKETIRMPGNWSPVLRNDNRELSSSSSSYHTPSSGGSPCGSNGRPACRRVSSSLEECKLQLSDCSSLSDNSNPSLTPTNSPSKASTNRDVVETNSEWQSSSFVRSVNNAYTSDVAEPHNEPTYGYLPFKNTSSSVLSSKTNHSTNLTLSSLHIKKNCNKNGTNNNIQGNSPTRKISSSEDYKCPNLFYRHNKPTGKSYAVPPSENAKENYPVNSYIYGTASSPNHYDFFPSSTKRHNGKTPDQAPGHAVPSTPVTIRSNSSMKLRSPKIGDEDWC